LREKGAVFSLIGTQILEKNPLEAKKKPPKKKTFVIRNPQN